MTRSPRGPRVLLAMWSTVGVGCSHPPGDLTGVENPAPLQGPVRLAEVLGAAHFAGPPARVQHFPVGGASGSDAGPVRRLDPGDPPSTAAVSVPPRSWCEAEVTVQTIDRRGLQLRTGASLIVRERLRDGSTVDHTPAAGVRGTETRRLRVGFETDRRVSSVDLLLSPGDGGGGGEARFSELGLACGALWASLRRGLSEDTPLIGNLEVARDTRRTLLSSAPGRWRVRVDPGQGMTFRTALGRDARSRGPLCGRVRFAEVELWAGCAAEAWEPLAVGLPGGAPGWLELELERGEGPAAGGWGEPVLLPDPAPAPPPLPDLLLVVVDTLRADAVGEDTPAIAALARQAQVFSQARSEASWTLPATASLLTGVLPSVHGAGWRSRREWSTGRGNTARKRRLDHHGIARSAPSLAEDLRTVGYQTAMVHTNHFLDPAFGFARGFDRYLRYDGNSAAGLSAALPLVDALLEELPRERGPRLLVVHAFEPHLPYRVRPPERPPAGLVAHMEAEEGSVWLVRDHTPETTEDVAALRETYRSELRWLDQQVAALLDRLPQAVVALTADHGEAFGEHGRFGHGHLMKDEVLRVPLILRVPGTTPATRATPVGLVDLSATLRAIAGVPPVGPGRDLRQTLDDRVVVSEHAHRGPDQLAMVLGTRKLVLTLPEGGFDPVVGAATLRLDSHALADDPGEHRPGAVPDPELRSLAMAHLAERLPGTHLRCAPGAQARVTLHGGLMRLVPLAQGPGTDVGHAPEVGALELRVGAADDPLWIVVETTGVQPVVVVPPAACTVKQVVAPAGAQATGAVLGAELAAALEALGYLEGGR